MLSLMPYYGDERRFVVDDSYSIRFHVTLIAWIISVRKASRKERHDYLSHDPR
jgi:uncharacterized DUF497 family protein